jgi:putative hydrolase of the HAD superfamily
VAEPNPPVIAATVPRGVIFDWGGVLTIPIADSVRAWLEADQIDVESYASVMRPWISHAYGPHDHESPVHALERGELTDSEFEVILASRLVHVTGAPVAADGLLRRMFAASALQHDMLDTVRELRADGLRTGLLSNSWGVRDGYPRHLFGDLFDDVVISGEVGMRKPEERIFLLALDRLGLSPAECVFVDDVEGNVTAAQALGMTVVHHRDTAATRSRLSTLLAL